VARWRTFQRTLVGLNLLLGVAGGYFAMLLFVRGIVRRTEYVEANAIRLADGHTLEPPIPGSDELSRLSEALDQTARQLAEQSTKLRESEARLRHVVKNAPVLLHALDSDGRITFSEGQALEALELQPGELVGHAASEVLAEWPDVLEHCRRALAGESLTTTAEIAHATFEMRYLPTLEAGLVSGVIVVGTDVSERREAERVLLRYQEMLEGQNAELARMSELKDEFIAKMSHELRTPLTAVIGFAELLRDEDYVGPISAQQEEYVEIILNASEHLLTLINDLLDLSKIEAGMMRLEPESVDLRGAVANALTIIEGEARKKALRVEARLPATLEPLTADARKLRQILYNLLSNAVKYTPDAGSVELVVYDQGDEVRIEIRDSGPGIAPEDQQRLFQPFVQLEHAGAQRVEGTGLGLALTKQLVELHGGRVWLYSRVGRGSTFGFSLPR
jgi:signal transduction histidine kinase